MRACAPGLYKRTSFNCRALVLGEAKEISMPKTQPENSTTVTPYFILKDAAKALDFYRYVLNAKEEFRLDTPDGKVMHASMRIGDSEIMMTEQCAMSGEVTRASTYVFIDDPDAALERAREKGASILMEPADMFYGHRTASFKDPYGQDWTVAKVVEEVSEEEMKRRGKEMFQKAA
jgi:PhnB protein